MQIEALGHIVLKVTDLERSRAFYHDLLGIPISAISEDWKMIFFTLGDHHNLAILEIESEVDANFGGVGVDHFAFKLLGGVEALKRAKDELEAAGLDVAPIDHNVSFSLYFHDPDGIKVEIYVDGVAGWEDDPSKILTEARTLTLV